MRLIGKSCAAVALGVFLVSPAALLAQSETSTGVPGWVFTPAISFGGLWDDNVLLLHPDSEPQPDYASPVNPSANLDFTGRRTKLSAAYDGAFLFHRTLSELNSYQQSMRARVTHSATRRVVVFGEESLTIAPTTDALELAGVPFFRVGSRSNSLGGGVEAVLAAHTSLRSAYTLRSVDFDADQRQGLALRGGHAHEITSSIDQGVSKVLSIGGEYTFMRALVNAPEPLTELPGTTPEPTDDFNIHSASFNTKFLATSQLTLTGGVGVAKLGAGLHHEARTGPTWNAGLVHRGRRSVASVEYRRSYIPSYGFGGTSQNRELTGSFQYPFARNRAYVQASASLFDNEPLDEGLPALRSSWIDSRVGYLLTRWLRIEGFYGRAHQDSQLEGGKRDRNTIGFQIVTSKPFKLQ